MKENNLSPLGIIILAAGGSSRLGTPKQLLKDDQGLSFIKNIAKTALSVKECMVACVLGSNHQTIHAEIADLNIEVIINPDWQQGIASSIVTGTQSMTQRHPELDALVFLVCDQPFVTHQLIQTIVGQYDRTGKPIIACHYKNIMGTPALFNRSIFPELMSLVGDTGAGQVIKADVKRVALVQFEEGIFDIDTKQDYNLFIS